MAIVEESHVNPLYKIIYTVFWLCAIGSRNKTVFGLNVFITLYCVQFIASFAVVANNFKVTGIFALLIIISFTIKWVLVIRFRTIQEISKQITKLSERLNTPSGSHLKKWIYILLCLEISLLLLATTLRHVVDNRIVTKLITFGHDDLISSRVLEISLQIVHFYLFDVMKLFPLIIFELYYMVVCYHLRQLVEAIQKLMSDKNSDYFHLLHCYRHITALINKVDDELSFFVVASSYIYASDMYYGFRSVIVHSLHFGEPILSYYFSLRGFCGFFITMVSAIRVNESTHSIYIKAHHSIINMKTPEQKQFLSNCAVPSLMTVWKMVPIRRSIILAILSTIFTYSLLIDGI